MPCNLTMPLYVWSLDKGSHAAVNDFLTETLGGAARGSVPGVGCLEGRAELRRRFIVRFADLHAFFVFVAAQRLLALALLLPFRNV